jgi:hypothetical protein
LKFKEIFQLLEKMIFEDEIDIFGFAEAAEEEIRGRQKPTFRKRQYFELENFKERFRLSRLMFDDLLNTIGPRLRPKSNYFYLLNKKSNFLSFVSQSSCSFANR